MEEGEMENKKGKKIRKGGRRGQERVTNLEQNKGKVM